MTLLDVGKRLVPERLKWKVKVAMGVPNMEASLLNMRRNGFHPQRVIDVGAYSGEWTQMCRRIFPDSRVLMIEPQGRLRPTLERLAAADAHLEFSPVLVGSDIRKEVAFYEAETASSLFQDARKSVAVPSMLSMTTLDEVTRTTDFGACEFIKLDTQGAELAILEGAGNTPRTVEAVLMEVNLLELYSGVPLIDRVVPFMAERGFRVYDICSFIHRPLDNVLWQADLIFVKSSSPLLASKSWGKDS